MRRMHWATFLAADKACRNATSGKNSQLARALCALFLRLRLRNGRAPIARVHSRGAQGVAHGAPDLRRLGAVRGRRGARGAVRRRAARAQRVARVLARVSSFVALFLTRAPPVFTHETHGAYVWVTVVTARVFSSPGVRLLFASLCMHLSLPRPRCSAGARARGFHTRRSEGCATCAARLRRGSQPAFGPERWRLHTHVPYKYAHPTSSGGASRV